MLKIEYSLSRENNPISCLRLHFFPRVNWLLGFLIWLIVFGVGKLKYALYRFIVFLSELKQVLL
jgi:hypothetical protein